MEIALVTLVFWLPMCACLERDVSLSRCPYGPLMCERWCHDLSRDYCLKFHFNCSSISCIVTVNLPQRKTDGYTRLGTKSLWVNVYNISSTWSNALAMCEMDGGTLFAPYSVQLQDLYTKIIFPRVPRLTPWIGLCDKYDNDTWYWVIGSEDRLVEGGWGGADPHNEYHGEKENCGFMSPRTYGHGTIMQWRDDSCDKQLSFACERKISLTIR